MKGKITIIGVGGVDSGESAYDKLLAGANFLQLYTGLVYQGPNIVMKIKKELKKIEIINMYEIPRTILIFFVLFIVIIY